MQIVYIYDVKARSKKHYNRIKRRFYYHMNKLPIRKENWKTKSSFAIPRKHEDVVDMFFKSFKGSVEVYKLTAQTIEEL